jgi:hypothetical protein
MAQVVEHLTSTRPDSNPSTDTHIKKKKKEKEKEATLLFPTGPPELNQYSPMSI